MESRGFRDENGTEITIPGTSVKISNAQAGNLVEVGPDGTLRNGGPKTFVREQGQALPFDCTNGVFSWSDEGMGEECLAIIKNAVPGGYAAQCGIAITDAVKNKTYLFVGLLSWVKTTTPDPDPSRQAETDEYALTIQIGATTLNTKISVVWIQGQDDSYELDEVTATGDALALDALDATSRALALAGKVDTPASAVRVPFDVSSGSLVAVQDDTEYDDILGLVSPGVTVHATVMVGIYDAGNDEYVYFLGIAAVSGTYSSLDASLEEVHVTIYAGGYTIRLEKNVLTSAISISVKSIAALLS